jgi:hypothetical protein
MQTHAEIHDAIQQVALLPSEDTNGQILEILHALNDRISESEIKHRVRQLTKPTTEPT